jgi:hypothetical protein
MTNDERLAYEEKTEEIDRLNRILREMSTEMDTLRKDRDEQAARRETGRTGFTRRRGLMALTRDDLIWWFGMLGGVAIALAGNFTLFPWIPPAWQHGISLVAFLSATVSGWMKTSPLPGAK